MPPAWLPTTADLGKLLAGQTIGAREDATANSGNFGKVTGTIPADRTAFAQAAIDLAYRKPARKIGDASDEKMTGPAKDYTLAKAAAHYVSIAYSDQMTQGQRSRAEEYWSRIADELWADLVDAVGADAGGDEDGPDDDVSSGRVRAFFPPSRLRDCNGYERVV